MNLSDGLISLYSFDIIFQTLFYITEHPAVELDCVVCADGVARKDAIELCAIDARAMQELVHDRCGEVLGADARKAAMAQGDGGAEGREEEGALHNDTTTS